jgi:2-iminobutanoate/2-iminopropanoate deaminase
LQSVLVHCKGSLGNVVKTTVFLKDMNDFAAMNRSTKPFYGRLPRRSTVQVARLPRFPVEIEAVAVL